MTWLVIGALMAGTVALKSVGPLTVAGRRPPERAMAVIALVAPAVLAALVVYETLTAKPSGIHVDARPLGLGVAALAIAARLPMLAVVLIAAAATALARAVT